MAHGLVGKVYEELTTKRRDLDEQLVELRERVSEIEGQLVKIDAQLEVVDRLRSANGTSPASAERDREKPKRGKGNVSKSILRLVKTEPGLTRSEIADRLENVVRTASGKGSRRVVTNRIWLLTSKGRVIDVDGRIFVPGAANNGSA